LISINKSESGRGAASLKIRTSFIKQNGNFEKSQELKGLSAKFKNP
jgi:hypothetical protein